MDVFGTVITTATLIITYIDTTTDYPDEARSLYHRIKWDLHAVKAVAEHLQKRAQVAGPSPPDDLARLLDETADYLPILMDKATASFAKLQATGLWRRVINQGLFFRRREELRQLQQEMNEWTRRFGVRLLALPPDVRAVIPEAAADGNKDRAEAVAAAALRPVLQANMRLQQLQQQFAALTPTAQKERIAELRRDTPPDCFVDVEIGSNPVTVKSGAEEFILTSRQSPPGFDPGTDEFERLASDMGELAMALHSLDPDVGVGLLKVEYYVYHQSTRRFLFVQVPPYPVGNIMTLENMIEMAPYSYQITKPHLNTQLPLDQRLNLAKKLAEAVFFLHTADFVHKNIRPSSIATLQRPGDPPFPASMGDLYLMGFDMIRSNDGVTVLEGAYGPMSSSQCDQDTVATRNLRVFQHPDRLQGHGAKRYSKTYDVYSLGVVLLQLGFWERITAVTRRLTPDCSGWPEELRKISEQLVLRTGGRYQRVVPGALD